MNEFVIVLCMALLAAGVALRFKRIGAITQSLADPGLDDETKRELARGLSSHRPEFRAWLIGLGWLLFVCGAFGAMACSSRDFSQFMTACGLGFALLSMPIVLRELDPDAPKVGTSKRR